MHTIKDYPPDDWRQLNSMLLINQFRFDIEQTKDPLATSNSALDIGPE